MENKKSLYSKLIEAVDALPENARQDTKGKDTKKGYDTSGYGYQFLVNVLNEVVGLGNWGMTYKILKEMKGSYQSGTEYFDITSEVTIWIMDGEKKAEFSNVGGHQSRTYNDALKGSITNGFKKTLSYFGVGKKAYEGTMDEDNETINEEIKPIAPIMPKIDPIKSWKDKLATLTTKEEISSFTAKVLGSEKMLQTYKDELQLLAETKYKTL
jgi:hypothetical protein